MTSLLCCRSTRDLPTVNKVDLQKYTGTWYEIARFPHGFEEGLKCVTATYSLKDNGKIKVENRGRPLENPSEVKKATGTARIPDKSEPGKLKVVFFWPFGGDYYILELDDDYQHVLVGSPSRKYLWILARDPQLDESTYRRLVDKAQNLGFDTTRLMKVEQDCW